MLKEIPELTGNYHNAKPLVVKIRENDCWEVRSHSTTRGGYARLMNNNKAILAHRLSYETFVGEIPEAMCVLHKCDNPICVNPKHLFLGTYLDNSNDMRTKGRHVDVKGEEHGRSNIVLSRHTLAPYPEQRDNS